MGRARGPKPTRVFNPDPAARIPAAARPRGQRRTVVIPDRRAAQSKRAARKGSWRVDD